MSDSTEQVIEDAINDFNLPEEVEETTTTEELSTEAATNDEVVVEGAEKVTEGTTEVVEETPPQVLSPEDELLKSLGISSKSVTGRENRLPHSRVQKIVGKAIKDTAARVAKEAETKLQPRIQEFETKVKDYEEKLTKHTQFENLVNNNPRGFLELLSQVPAYKPFFDHINKLAEAQAGGTTTTPAAAKPVTTDDPRPMPNRELADGSKVYDLEGLEALEQWQARQIEKRLEERISKRYAPIEEQWQLEQRRQQLQPVIDQQINEARTWLQFSENEDAIIEVMKADPKITLEGAYRKVVLPKLVPDKDKMRAELIAELKKKPASTAAPATRTSPAKQVPAGKRPLEDIIMEEIRKASA